MFTKQAKKSLMAKFSQIDINDIQDIELRQKAKALKSKQRGFTLLELLVVVAILAAIAGTATIALQDTDARASAAAHVAMMDELNKGIRTFRVLRKNTLPSGFDSLIEGNNSSPTGDYLSIGAAGDSLTKITLTAGMAEAMHNGGIKTLQYINNTQTPADSPVSCLSLEKVVASRANAVVAGNIFMSPAGNGCGFTWALNDSGADADWNGLNGSPEVMIWNSDYERVMGEEGRGLTNATAGAPVLLAVGLGPSSNLFNSNDLGGLTSVPVYRHVSATEYNRFIALFNIGKVSTNTAAANYYNDAPVSLTTIVDGAGDTKEEELGEWDGTRSTI